MKRQFITGLAVMAAASVLCGFDSAETADSIGQKMNEAGSSIQNMAADMSFNLDLNIGMSDGENETALPVKLSYDLATDLTMEPFAMKMEGPMSVSALMTDQSVTTKEYMIPGDSGEMKIYAYADPGDGTGQWMVQTLENLDIQSLAQRSLGESVSLAELKEWGIDFALAPEAADFDGTECYLLSTEIDSDSLNTLLMKASEVTGQDLMAVSDMDQMLDLLSGLRLKLEYYVDTATYLPIGLHMDMNDSDLSTLETLLSAYVPPMSEDAPATSFDLALNDMSMDMSIAWDAAEEIVLPEEALSAQEISSEDALSELDSAIEAAEGAN